MTARVPPVALAAGLSGAAALVLQVTWQRTIAIHGGIDVTSTTVVVTVFLAGLGVGSLLGGRLADRVGARRALGALAVAELCVAVVAAASTPVLFALSRAVAPHLGSPLASLGFAVAVLGLPTTLMGLSLPLAVRAVTDRLDRAGPRAGLLVAANTAGAAAGALLGGWLLIGALGLVGTTLVAAAVELLAAVILAVVAVVAVRTSPERPAGQAEEVGPEGPAAPLVVEAGRPAAARLPWMAVYAATGAVALGFEQVFFRLVDGIMRSNTYTFSLVLALYLVLYALGAAAGAWGVRRVADPRPWFLGLQAAVGVTAVGSLVVVLALLRRGPLAPAMEAWVARDGFANGFDARAHGDLAVFGVVVPMAVMAAPVTLMGASLPLVQRIVARRLDDVGRVTGRLVAANLAGNVAGTLLTGFVLLDRLGVAGTYAVLSVPLVAAGVAAVRLSARPRLAGARSALAVLALVATVAAAPTERELWAALNDVGPDRLILAEDRSCAAAVILERDGPGARLTLDGTSQNSYPFDDFHVLIGLLPALAHPEGAEALAVGFGIGSTSFALLASGRVAGLTSVDVCRGTFDLVERLADGSRPELDALVADPRHRRVDGDGRAHLLTGEGELDIVVSDHSRAVSAGAGNLFSQEFYELVRDRLAPDGVASGWLPTHRVENAVTATFPYAASVTVASYGGSRLFLASRSPLELEPAVLAERFDRVAHLFREPQRTTLRRSIVGLEPTCLTDGGVASGAPARAVNRDLHPRDEHFIANPPVAADDAVRTC